VVDPKHSVVLICVAFIGRDQVSGSVPIIDSIRRRKEIEKLLYSGIDSDGKATI